ncbi:MAG: TIGR03619 family F420-dependent LLM class oxidoreductase [Rhodocyclaceae bacterium]|jgi:probable F420-dependent oxidoreductase|nr:TIGR03619 family F420-dependent LLM class oxidoreductase [Rhodocyclaceae bacterium]MBK6555563.1 TIGR03619 family F420-dependent LLM class oxidoreductase [Rhodocyclaceae bacterium]MBK6676533.1 TIGR03619 family F420-dependent LLM class oxidoreductase [Rhodocyclaceae bacterium]MBK9312586.1 TIGR03619 family F420-dependent LLM class oxidoreductase [Rhodocyclaceae bacterium]MBK9955761.1 TIGR03619 family F420-dependent LLM class oxidoreductase [Rhodocyclaceae bacterium]
MRFGFHLFMVDPAEHREIARTADECGWDSIQVADAPFFPEKIAVPYPYTPDGTRFWPLDIPVLDPWVAITAMATVTSRIRFLPSVLRLAIRQPLLEAKSLCSVAAIANDRVALGVGLAWMPEEFKWLGVDMKTRGARQDEAIQVIRLLLRGGMQEFHGKHFDFDRLIMAPVPKQRIPIYVGGTTPPALRRAARLGDGWVSVIHDLDQVEGMLAELNGYRREYGREHEPFDVMMHCPDAESVDDIRRLEALGVTDLQVTPWSSPGILAEMGVGTIMQQQPPLAVKLEAIKRYAARIIEKFA